MKNSENKKNLCVQQNVEEAVSSFFSGNKKKDISENNYLIYIDSSNMQLKKNNSEEPIHMSPFKKRPALNMKDLEFCKNKVKGKNLRTEENSYNISQLSNEKKIMTRVNNNDYNRVYKNNANKEYVLYNNSPKNNKLEYFQLIPQSIKSHFNININEMILSPNYLEGLTTEPIGSYKLFDNKNYFYNSPVNLNCLISSSKVTEKPDEAMLMFISTLKEVVPASIKSQCSRLEEENDYFCNKPFISLKRMRDSSNFQAENNSQTFNNNINININNNFQCKETQLNQHKANHLNTPPHNFNDKKKVKRNISIDLDLVNNTEDNNKIFIERIVKEKLKKKIHVSQDNMNKINMPHYKYENNRHQKNNKIKVADFKAVSLNTGYSLKSPAFSYSNKYEDFCRTLNQENLYCKKINNEKQNN